MDTEELLAWLLAPALVAAVVAGELTGLTGELFLAWLVLAVTAFLAAAGYQFGRSLIPRPAASPAAGSGGTGGNPRR